MAVEVLDVNGEEIPEYEPYRPQSFDVTEEVGVARMAHPSTPRDRDPGDFEQAYSQEQVEQGAFEGRRAETHGEETDFASLKFQRENTLLTNAENYAASIREEAELYVKQLRVEAETLDRETELRYQEALQAKEQAQAEAERLLAEAESKTQEVREQAYEEGFQAGNEEGLRQRYEEGGVLLERLEHILEEAEQFRDRLTYYTEKDGVRLAMLMARQILHTELKINKAAVLKLLASTLAKLDGQGTFRVWLNPEDHQFALKARKQLERFLDEDQHLTLRSKPDLSPGNILIETDREMIDLTFQSQFYHLEQLLNQTLSERETVLTQRTRTGASTAPGHTTVPSEPAESE